MRTLKVRLVRELIINTKSRPCADCDIQYPWFVMDLDHVRGKKKFNLSQAAAKCYAISTVEAEIAKCEVVCSNCHRIRTYARMGIGG